MTTITITEMSGCVGIRLCRIPTHLFGNPMVVIHPSLSKDIHTQSAEFFRDERITDFLPGRKAAKDTISAADAFLMVFSFLF